MDRFAKPDRAQGAIPAPSLVCGGTAGPPAGERGRQPQIRKAIAASASSAAPMFFSLSRHSSPVSRRRRRFGASSTASRAAGPGAESGATLIDLRRFNGGSEFAWTADGGLALDCVNAVRVVVAPGGLSWSTEADGGAAHPIAEAEAHHRPALRGDFVEIGRIVSQVPLEHEPSVGGHVPFDLVRHARSPPGRNRPPNPIPSS